jgi:hypothetical protein
MTGRPDSFVGSLGAVAVVILICTCALATLTGSELLIWSLLGVSVGALIAKLDGARE